MSCCRISLAFITTHSHKDLRAAYKLHGRSLLIGGFCCTAPLTPAQVRRLPARLRRMLTVEEAAD